jgi:formylglycine-generating enzyme required for sulfatase activity
MKKNIILAMQKVFGGWLVVMFLLVACTEDDGGKVSNDTFITFSSHLSGITSRTDSPEFISTKESWSVDDSIGVFYIDSEAFSKGSISIIDGVRNAKYVSTQQGFNTIFTSATEGDKLYYSYNNTPKRFLAYYPYIPVVNEDFIYPIDITHQSETDLSEIDLLYAVTSGDKSLVDATVPLTFKHQLSKLVLNMSESDSRYYDNMKVTATGFYTKANFSLVNGSIKGRADNSDTIDLKLGPHGRIEMLVIPQLVENGFIVFKWNGMEAEWLVKKEFEAGKEYEYSLHLDFPTIKVSGESISEWGEGEKYSVDPEEPDPDAKIDIIDKLLVKFTGDTYLIGSPQGVGSPNEWPQHKAGIGTFWITPYEITNAQYALFLNANKDKIDSQGIMTIGEKKYVLLYNDVYEPKKQELYFENGGWGCSGRGEYPVVNVTWYGAREFARWIGGDLPTEREWETACRAGTEGVFSFDISDDGKNMIDYVNCKDRSVLIYDREPGTMPVYNPPYYIPNINMRPNAKGLYHMHGNVSEWCLDAVMRSASGSPASYAEENMILEQNDSTLHVIRGGSWRSLLVNCRSASRDCLLPIPTRTSNDVGFRVAFPIKNILNVTAENLENLKKVMSLVGVWI